MLIEFSCIGLCICQSGCLTCAIDWSYHLLLFQIDYDDYGLGDDGIWLVVFYIHHVLFVYLSFYCLVSPF